MKSSRPLEFHFLNDNKEIYFLTSFKKPANLKLTLNLNTYLFGEPFQKTITVNNHITSIDYPVKFVFFFTVKNAVAGQVFTYEGLILNYFRKSLWGLNGDFSIEPNYNLDIISIRPHKDKSSFTFEIGSNLPLSDRLLELVQVKKENLKQCNSTRHDELDWFKKETTLEMDLCSVAYRETNYDYSKDEDYTLVDVNYNVKIGIVPIIVVS